MSPRVNPAACGRAPFVSLVLQASSVALCRLRARLPHKLRASDEPAGTTLAGRKTAR